MNKIAESVGEMETQLKQWGTKLDELAAVAEKAGAEAKLAHHKRIDDLRPKYQMAQMKLNELRAAGIENGVAIQASIDSAWKELEVAFRNLKE